MTRSVLRRSSLAAAFTIPLAFAGAASASAPGWFMSNGVMYSPGASGGFFYEDSFVYTPIGLEGIKISGSAGPVTGGNASFPGNFAGNPITIEFTGGNSHPIDAGLAIGADIDINFLLDGGSVRILNSSFVYTDFNSGSAVNGGTDYTPAGAFPDSGGNFLASFNTGALPSAFGFSTWTFRLQFEFLDTTNAFLIVSIPNNSVDLRVIPTPSAGVGLLLATGLVARRRRRV